MNAPFHQGLEILLEHHAHDRIARIPALFNDGHEQRSWTEQHSSVMPATMDRALVGFGSDGGFGGDHADAWSLASAAGFDGSPRTGLDYAADRKFRELRSKLRQGKGGGCIAGDD